MTNPISFDPFLAWVDTNDPDNLPPEVHVISADDLLRYENHGVAATAAINSLITDIVPLTNATAAATASTLVLRDASGRAKFATPAATTDAATKGYVDGGGAKPFAHMGLLGGNQNVNNTKLTFSTAQILRSGMTFNDANDALVVPAAGYYRLSVRGYSVGAGFGTEVVSININGATETGINARYYKTNTQPANGFCSGVKLLAANDQIGLYATTSSNVAQWGTDGFNGTYLEVEYMYAP